MSTWSNCSLACRSITSYSKFTIELVFHTGLRILLNVLPSFWAYPGSYSPSAHVITFSTSAVNVVNESVWRNLVDQCMFKSHLVDVVDLFHVSMFSHLGWQDGTVCVALITYWFGYACESPERLFSKVLDPYKLICITMLSDKPKWDFLIKSLLPYLH